MHNARKDPVAFCSSYHHSTDYSRLLVLEWHYASLVKEFKNTGMRYRSIQGVSEPIDHIQAKPVQEEHCRLGRCQENGFKKQKGVMDKCVQMFHENIGTFTFPTGRECICEFRTNRIREAEGRLLWPTNDKGQRTWCGPALVFKSVFLEDERRALKKKGLGRSRIEIGVERVERP
ncbi:hypothetical protein TNCV_625031 [Trichonephila clavipes]|nr:hypothetical protein TNCV_625031 [Trichonephila clavipes]